MNRPSDTDIVKFFEFLIDKKNENSSSSYDAIKSKINELFFPIPTITVQKGTKLFRSRVHDKGEKIFTDIQDFSYRKDYDNIKTFGRANEPHQSIFYCSDDEYVAFFESSKIVRNQTSPEIETMSTGVWEVKEDLRLAHIVGNEKIRGLNRTVDGLQNSFEDLVAKFKDQNTDLYLKALSLFSDEFTREANNSDFNYFITCAFSNYLYDLKGIDTYLNKTTKLDGILYPSVMHKSQGMNLALKPETVDVGKIQLIKAFRKEMKEVEYKEYSDVNIIESSVILYPENIIRWNKNGF